MQMHVCVFLALIATASCSLSVIGEVDDGALPSKDGLSNFLETAILPQKEGSDFISRMVVPKNFVHTFGEQKLDHSRTFSRAQVDKLTYGTNILEHLGLQDAQVFNASTFEKIVTLAQDDSFVNSAREARDSFFNAGVGNSAQHIYKFEGKKMCYCHEIDMDDTDGTDNLSAGDSASAGEEGEEDDHSVGVAYYVALWVGGPKYTANSFEGSYDSDNEDFDVIKAHGNDGYVFYNPGHEGKDLRICLPFTLAADIELGGLEHQNQEDANEACLDCCVESFTDGDVFGVKPRFWGAGGCPVVKYGNFECAPPVIQDAFHSFHYHLRNLESLKMFTIATRSRDASEFCSNFAKPSVREVAAGNLNSRSCENQVAAYELLARNDLEFMNTYEVALRACRMDGQCGAHLDMKSAFPFYSGDNCAQCMSSAYLAATDLAILSRNNIDGKLLCEVTNNAHPAMRDLSHAECDSLSRTFREKSGAIFGTAAEFCSNQCTYSSNHKYRLASGKHAKSAKISEIQDAKFWKSIEI